MAVWGYRNAEAQLFDGDALPDGWADSPADYGASVAVTDGGDIVITLPEVAAPAAPAPDPLPDDKDALVALAAERGVDIDKRWGVERLKEALGG